MVVATLAILTVASDSTASAQTSLDLRTVGCGGVTINGTGLPPGTPVTMTLTNPQGRTLEHQQLMTSPTGLTVPFCRIRLGAIRAGTSPPVARHGDGPLPAARHSDATPDRSAH